LDPEELATWKSLSLMHLQLSARLGQTLAEYGVSLQDYIVMASLSDRPDGRCRIVELATELGWEKSRLSHHLSRMCERKLVEKIPCPIDQRGVFVVLTSTGQGVLADVAPVHVDDVRHFFIDLTSSIDRQHLRTVAEAVLQRLADESFDT
jgi:DNA-binding MarR family transcriptional regulator